MLHDDPETPSDVPTPYTPQRPTTASRQQSEGRFRSQEELKALLELEIQDAVFQCADIVDVLYGPMTSTLQSWLPKPKQLEKCFAALTACPITPERRIYQELQKLCDEITAGIPEGQGRVVFSIYDRIVEDKPDGSGELKPDLAGAKDAIAAGERVPWRLIIIAIEVKANSRNGFIQSLTYARCMLTVGDKWFAPLLFYNQKTRALYGVFVTRFGVFVTPAISLLVGPGKRAAAEMILRMSVGHSAAFEPSKRIDDDGRLCLARGSALSPSLRDDPESENWLTLDLLSQRVCAIGRATRVYSCSAFVSTTSKPEPANNPTVLSVPEDDDSQHAADAPRAVPPRHHARSALADNEQPASIFAPTNEQPDTVAAWCNLMTAASANTPSPSAGVLDVPSVCICKSAWLPFPRHDIDKILVRALEGCHGCPDLIESVVARHPPAFARLGELISSGKMSRVNDTFWSYRTDGPLIAVFQPMVQVYSFYRSVGHPLRTIVRHPLRLAHAVKDAIVGLALAFSKKRHIHRDVTRTNVLVYKSSIDVGSKAYQETVEELAKGWPEFKDLLDNDGGFRKLFRERHAFLNDFEHAVVWDDLDRVIAVARSGTPEYMSYQLLVHFVEGRDRIHTLLDDLESCIWVPFHEVLDAFPELRTDAEEALLAGFTTDDYRLVCFSKSRLLRLRQPDHERGSALSSTWPLWSRLIPIADDLQQKAVSAVNDYLGRNSGRDSSASQGRPEGQPPSSASLTQKRAALIERLHQLSRDGIIRYLLGVKEAIEELSRVAKRT